MPSALLARYNRLSWVAMRDMMIILMLADLPCRAGRHCDLLEVVLRDKHGQKLGR